MKRSLVVLAVLALLSSQAAADRRTWRDIFFGAAAFAVASSGVWIYGALQVNDAENRLCELGAYPSDPKCGLQGTRPNQEQLDEINRQGQRGSSLTVVGSAGVITSAVIAGIAAFNGFGGDDGTDRKVVVAPTVTSSSAGAAVQIRF